VARDEEAEVTGGPQRGERDASANRAPPRSEPPNTGGASVLSRGREGTPLSEREREILHLLAQGESGAAIAERLVLSPETVRTHIRNAMTKLGATSRAQAVALAVRRGEIGEDGTSQPSSGGVAPSRRHERRDLMRGRAGVVAGEWDDALGALLGGLVSLRDVEGGVLYVVERDGLAMRRVAAAGAEEIDRSFPAQVALGEGPVGRSALERRAHGYADPAGSGGRTTICAPMVGKGVLLGLICLTMRPSRLTARHEILLLQAFSNRVAEMLLSGVADKPGIVRSFERFRDSWIASGSPD
jgi:DNA-binding CsgD family transcriptional regulator